MTETTRPGSIPRRQSSKKELHLMNQTSEDRARSRRRKGIIAGVAGAALLLTGGTFALWQATTDVTGGTITAGNLTLDSGASAAWYDVSPDRDFALPVAVVEDKASEPLVEGEVIDVAQFLVSPEDVLAAVFEVEVGLEGDNLVASLDLNLAAAAALGEGVDPFEDGDLTFESAIYIDNEEAVARAALAPGKESLGYFTTSAAHEATDVTLVSGTVHATVVIFVTFNNTVGAESSMDAVAALNDAGFSLTQIREWPYGAFVAPEPTEEPG